MTITTYNGFIAGCGDVCIALVAVADVKQEKQVLWWWGHVCLWLVVSRFARVVEAWTDAMFVHVVWKILLAQLKQQPSNDKTIFCSPGQKQNQIFKQLIIF